MCYTYQNQRKNQISKLERNWISKRETIKNKLLITYVNVIMIKYLMDIMWPANQSHFHLSFIFIKMKFYSLLFSCTICNEGHEHM